MTYRWTRRRIVYEFSGFPKCIAGIVAEYCMTLKLLDWIDPDDIDMRKLCANPGAIESGMIDLGYLSKNPGIFEYRVDPELVAILSE
jgi:hypothetical protein